MTASRDERRLEWLGDSKKFMDEVERGLTWEMRVAVALLATGYPVQHPQPWLSEGAARHGDLADEPDLVVAGRLAIEVKSRDLTFTGPDDFPFPTVFVGRKSRWDRRQLSPFAMVVVSQRTGGRLVVPWSSRDQWRPEQCRDGILDRDEVSYACPRELVFGWDRFVAELRRTLAEPAL